MDWAAWNSLKVAIDSPSEARKTSLENVWSAKLTTLSSKLSATLLSIADSAAFNTEAKNLVDEAITKNRAQDIESLATAVKNKFSELTALNTEPADIACNSILDSFVAVKKDAIIAAKIPATNVAWKALIDELNKLNNERSEAEKIKAQKELAQKESDAWALEWPAKITALTAVADVATFTAQVVTLLNGSVTNNKLELLKDLAELIKKKFEPLSSAEMGTILTALTTLPINATLNQNAEWSALIKKLEVTKNQKFAAEQDVADKAKLAADQAAKEAADKAPVQSVPETDTWLTQLYKWKKADGSDGPSMTPIARDLRAVNTTELTALTTLINSRPRENSTVLKNIINDLLLYSQNYGILDYDQKTFMAEDDQLQKSATDYKTGQSLLALGRTAIVEPNAEQATAETPRATAWATAINSLPPDATGLATKTAELTKNNFSLITTATSETDKQKYINEISDLMAAVKIKYQPESVGTKDTSNLITAMQEESIDATVKASSYWTKLITDLQALVVEKRKGFLAAASKKSDDEVAALMNLKITVE